MKTLTLTFVATVAGTLAAIAYAQPATTAAPKTVVVAMHDPGCHWFAVGGRFAKTASAAGPVRVMNEDEATLLARAANGKVKRIPVGTKATLGTGRYVITMVGQAPDDNHLVLTVR